MTDTTSLETYSWACPAWLTDDTLIRHCQEAGARAAQAVLNGGGSEREAIAAYQHAADAESSAILAG